MKQLGRGTEREMMIREVVTASPAGISLKDLGERIACANKRNLSDWIDAFCAAGEFVRVKGSSVLDTRICTAENAEATRADVIRCMTQRRFQAALLKKQRRKERQRKWPEPAWVPPQQRFTSIWHFAEAA